MKRLLTALIAMLPVAAFSVIVEFTLVENDVASTVGSVRTTAYPLGDAAPAEGGFTQTNPPAHVTLGTSTFHSIGMVWDPGTDDADHDATITCEYRKSGDDFSNCLNLIRSDWSPYYNGTSYTAQDEFGGSIMFLTPNTRYQIRLTYDDPDNTDSEDGNSYTFTADTRAIPEKPTGGTTYYVTTGSGSGNAGTSGDPFEGFAEAFGTVTAGDILRVKSGTYADYVLTASGTSANYIVIEEDPADPGAIIRSFEVRGDHLWIEGLTFTWDGNGTNYLDTSAIFTTSGNNPDNIVFTGNTVNCGYNNGIIDQFGTTRWTVIDNTFCGAFAAGVGDGGSGSFTGEGVILESPSSSSGHVIAYNDITRFADGISLHDNQDSDVYGNKIYDLADDAFEPDRSRQNVRAWGNHLSNAAAHVISFQPQVYGPWYFVRNQVQDGGVQCMKWRVQDRLVWINNTIMCGSLYGQSYFWSYKRNNLHIKQAANVWNSTDNYNPATGVPAEIDRKPDYDGDWYTDIDYNGYDRGGSGNFFNWDDNTTGYTSLATWSSSAPSAGVINLDANSIEVDADLIFTVKTIDPDISLELKSGTNAAVDAGVSVNNLGDFYVGTSPDLGAHERGATALHYGPRELASELVDRTDYWTKH